MAEATDLSNVIFQFARADLSQEVNLKPEEWRILSQINGARSISQIAQALGLDFAFVSQMADALYRGGLLQVAPGSVVPPSSTMDGAFFDHVIRQLTLTMGPFASVVVEDEIAALGETRDRFPRERIAELVERVGEAIDDREERLQFQKAMLNAIRKL
jgi:hypothetical protein